MGRRGRATLNGIEFSHKGWRDFLLGDGVRDEVSKATNSIASKAGPGFNPEMYEGDFGGGRWVGSVFADTPEAMRAEAEDKTLTKAVG